MRVRPIVFVRDYSLVTTPAYEESRPHAACIVTQVSLDKWGCVETLASAWRGPLSVCVYIPAPHGTSEAKGKLPGRRGLVSSVCSWAS